MAICHGRVSVVVVPPKTLRSFLGIDIKMEPFPLRLWDASFERAEAGEEEYSLVCLRKRCDYKAVRLMGMQLLESVSLLFIPTSETGGTFALLAGEKCPSQADKVLPCVRWSLGRHPRV